MFNWLNKKSAPYRTPMQSAKPGPSPQGWSEGIAPENTVLIVGQYGRQFVGGDGSPIYYPPQVAFAWFANDKPWVNYSTGQPLGWTPSCWMVLQDMPTKGAPTLSKHPAAFVGDLGL